MGVAYLLPRPYSFFPIVSLSDYPAVYVRQRLKLQRKLKYICDGGRGVGFTRKEMSQCLAELNKRVS